ncbi:MAG: hypothetical protein AVDCRST_MAG90-57 [uncultured Microvirga sp.]|uniref:Anti-sigma K factor RskA C-terminal domain-containing protein n=1 Tax=uncultured Microvirga sp. TaxID=412392 RepID=A0A6J4KHP4_9HYPH|nr:MAG: hypothetical protein AVDCRST_MAG90-57 [uncultured Microvirga sp.]
MSPDEMDRLAAEHVLGLLEGEEASRAEALLRDPTFEVAVATWSERFAALDHTAPEMPVPDGVWGRIQEGIEAPAAGAATPPQPLLIPNPVSAFQALWRSLAFWRATGLASAATAALLAVGLGLTATRTSPQPVLVAVLLTEGGGARPAAVVNTFADGRAELVPLEEIPVPAGRALEVWTLWDRAVGPRSIGLLDRIRSAPLNIGNLPKATPNQLFEITLEPAGGSPTGRPTGPILMKGTTSTAL